MFAILFGLKAVITGEFIGGKMPDHYGADAAAAGILLILAGLLMFYIDWLGRRKELPRLLRKEGFYYVLFISAVLLVSGVFLTRHFKEFDRRKVMLSENIGPSDIFYGGPVRWRDRIESIALGGTVTRRRGRVGEMREENHSFRFLKIEEGRLLIQHLVDGKHPDLDALLDETLLPLDLNAGEAELRVRGRTTETNGVETVLRLAAVDENHIRIKSVRTRSLYAN